jgi:hypothetical protein
MVASTNTTAIAPKRPYKKYPCLLLTTILSDSKNEFSLTYLNAPEIVIYAKNR